MLLDEIFANRDMLKTSNSFRDVHRAAVDVYTTLGQHELALEHLQALKRLDDEAARLTASANNALLAAEFDFANQELEITKLRAGQLQRDVQLAEQSAQFNRRIVIGVLAASFLIIGITLLALLNIRRRRDEVRAANVQLEGSNAELAKALDVKSEFLATTSHEIRTPLNGILGMTQVMLADEALDEQIRERVELVYGAGTAMKAIVDDILDVAKLDAGKLTLREEEFPLAETLRGVANVFADEARGKGLSFVCDLDACPERAIGDQQRVRQIVFNLVSNAVKFTAEGSVRVAAETCPEDADSLCLTVADSGVGIPHEEIEAIFAPFHQVDGSRTRQHSGTGLGLSICRELVDAMGGELSVESLPEEGAVFSLRLPLSLQAASAEEVQKETAAAAPASAAPNENHPELVIYAPNALVAAMARRAFPAGRAEFEEIGNFEAAISSARQPGVRTLALLFGGGGSAAQLSALRQLREDRPQLRIVAAGWPEGADSSPEDVCDAYVSELSAVQDLFVETGSQRTGELEDEPARMMGTA